MNLSAEWWEACGRRELLYRLCRDCGAATFVPRIHCANCSTELSWHRASGLGTVFATTVVHRSTVTAAGVAAPYRLAYIELQEGPLLLSSLLADAAIGDRVEVAFVEVDDLVVPVFAPVPAD